ncbi:MAG: YeeE/YedE thiosulfate transporter family protein [Dongiaceae bacterium]
METFTPLSATIGGLLIGLSATILWVVNGRTAGISNIAGGIYPVRRGDELWRMVFLIGLPVGGWIGYIIGPAILTEIPATLPVIELPMLWLVAAGLLVGVGTRVGRGCTSGHGVCGLSRFSVRSVVAVGTFMATAAITVFVVRHVLP